MNDGIRTSARDITVSNEARLSSSAVRELPSLIVTADLFIENTSWWLGQPEGQLKVVGR